MSAYRKTCLFCKHYYFDSGSQGYSSLTPGSDASMGCSKDHWWMRCGDTEEEHRAHMLMAETCKDFQEREDEAGFGEAEEDEMPVYDPRDEEGR